MPDPIAVDSLQFGLLELRASLGDDEVVDREVFRHEANLELEAVGEEGPEHVGALAVGEVLGVGDGGCVEFGFEVELVAVDPRRTAGDEFCVEDPVGFLNKLEQRDVLGGVAVGGRIEIPAHTLAVRLEGGDFEGEGIGGYGCGSCWWLGECGGSNEGDASGDKDEAVHRTTIWLEATVHSGRPLEGLTL